MRKFLLSLFLLASLSFVAIPVNANSLTAEKKSASSGSLTSQTRTRYVRLRGKRYRVTYRLYKRGGRWYYRIISYRRA